MITKGHLLVSKNALLLILLFEFPRVFNLTNNCPIIIISIYIINKMIAMKIEKWVVNGTRTRDLRLHRAAL